MFLKSLFDNSSLIKQSCTRKQHEKNSTAERLSKIARSTLGSGDIKNAVKLPKGESDVEWWLAANIVDFFVEVTLIWGLVCDINGPPTDEIGKGFPPYYEYRWAGDRKTKKVIRCSGPEYLNYAIEYIETQINDPIIFPRNNESKFLNNFKTKHVQIIFKMMFRIYAIIYSHHFQALMNLTAVAHLNTSFKHFLYFCWEWDLVEEKEFDALKDIVAELKIKFINTEV